MKEIGWESVDWIDLAQDRDKLQAIVHNTSGFHKMGGSSLLKNSVYQEGFLYTWLAN